MCGCLIRANWWRIGEIDGMYGQIIDILRFILLQSFFCKLLIFISEIMGSLDCNDKCSEFTAQQVTGGE